MWGSILGGLLGGAGSLFGGMMSNSANANATAATNATQMQLAQMQMDFQERMSNTAYQRATADMRAAGINPMLAATMGGASTPMGAQASLTAPHFENAAAGAAASAQQAAIAASQPIVNEKTKADTEQSKASAVALDAQSIKDTAQANSAAEQAKLMADQRAKLNGVDTDKTRAETEQARAAAGLHSTQAASETIRQGIHRANVTSAEQAAKLDTLKTQDYSKGGSGSLVDTNAWNRFLDSAHDSASKRMDTMRDFFQGQYNRWTR